MADYKARWRNYFIVNDGNKNGTIELDDAKFVAARVFPVGSAGYPAALVVVEEFIKPFIQDFDLNGDGKITPEEFNAGVEKYFISKSNFEEFPEWFKKQTDIFFNIIDESKNGALSFEEVKRFSKTAGTKASDAEIQAAFDYGVKIGGEGKFGHKSFHNLVFEFATSPKPTPEWDIIVPIYTF